MIAFGFTFPAGRYHATPWGRNVNEADVAWPPEPVRILRSLIATWWRKADQARFPKAMLDDLIDALAIDFAALGQEANGLRYCFSHCVSSACP